GGGAAARSSFGGQVRRAGGGPAASLPDSCAAWRRRKTSTGHKRQAVGGRGCCGLRLGGRLYQSVRALSGRDPGRVPPSSQGFLTHATHGLLDDRQSTRASQAITSQ